MWETPDWPQRKPKRKGNRRKTAKCSYSTQPTARNHIRHGKTKGCKEREQGIEQTEGVRKSKKRSTYKNKNRAERERSPGEKAPARLQRVEEKQKRQENKSSVPAPKAKNDVTLEESRKLRENKRKKKKGHRNRVRNVKGRGQGGVKVTKQAGQGKIETNGTRQERLHEMRTRIVQSQQESIARTSKVSNVGRPTQREETERSESRECSAGDTMGSDARLHTAKAGEEREGKRAPKQKSVTVCRNIREPSEAEKGFKAPERKKQSQLEARRAFRGQRKARTRLNKQKERKGQTKERKHRRRRSCGRKRATRRTESARRNGTLATEREKEQVHGHDGILVYVLTLGREQAQRNGRRKAGRSPGQ
ncbi:hypothetical protein Tco_0594768 [Tanacetum coccineum]